MLFVLVGQLLYTYIYIYIISATGIIVKNNKPIKHMYIISYFYTSQNTALKKQTCIFRNFSEVTVNSEWVKSPVGIEWKQVW